MSGEKETYVQVTQRQRDQWMAACREVDQSRVMQQHLRERLNQAQADSQRWAQESQAHYAGYESRLSSMSAGMQAMERDHAQRLAAQRAQFDAGLANLHQNLINQQLHFQTGMNQLGQRLDDQRGEYLQLISQQGTQLRAEMDAQRQVLQGQIQTLATAIEQKEAHEAGRARQWLTNTRTLLTEIDHTCKHREFKPGALDALRHELSMAEANHAQGLHQATVATAQQTVLRALELRLELERLENEWNAHQAAALMACRETLAWCDARTTTRLVLDTTTGSEELDAEIDYWTDGALTRLQN